MEFKQGDVLLFASNGINWKDKVYSGVIKLANRIHYPNKPWKEIKWSHAAIVGEVREWTVIVYEALSDGFVKSEYGIAGLLERQEKGTLCVRRSKYRLSGTVKILDSYLGRSYGWLDIAQIGLYTLVGKTSFLLSTDARKLICSEAVTRYLYDASNRAINLEPEFEKKFDHITPQDLYYTKFLETVKK